MIKLPREKTFVVFMDYQQTTKVFPTNFNTCFNKQNFKLFLFVFSKTAKVFPTL